MENNRGSLFIDKSCRKKRVNECTCLCCHFMCCLNFVHFLSIILSFLLQLILEGSISFQAICSPCSKHDSVGKCLIAYGTRTHAT